MKPKTAYSKYVETIKKEDFLIFFPSCEPETLFSKRELLAFSFPENSRSLAGRYLIKKTICNYLDKPGKMNEIEILNNESGKPELFFREDMLKSIEVAGIKKILCSISHSKNIIAGMTIICFK
jgi:phosphopantetheinyl transferase (holo-ACP synthase)